MATKIAIANQKGGIGKTTTALCLTAGLINRGYKVLLIDTDPQKSATSVYGAREEDTCTLADMLFSNTPASECIQKTALGDIIASDSLLKEAETRIPNDVDRFYYLKDTCKCIEDEYDYIIFDTPPGNGVLLGNVLSCADSVIMPITCDRFGIQGMIDFYNSMCSYKKRINPGIHISGVLIIKYKGRQSLTQSLEEATIPEIAAQIETKVYETKIRESVKCQESQVYGKSLFEYAPNSTTAIDYNMFIEELLKEKI